MASACLSLFLADQILDKLLSLEEDEQLISRGLKHELGEFKNSVSAVRAAFLCAEHSRQRDKGLKAGADVDIFFLEQTLCRVDLLVNELFCWVRETKRERERSVVVMPMLRRNLRNTTFTNLFLTNPMKRFQKEMKEGREELEFYASIIFAANISDRIKSGEEISIDSFGGDTEGETSSRKNKDEVIQSLIPTFPHIGDWQIEVIKSIGRRLLFENDDDDPDDVAINTLTNIFYFKYSEFYFWVFEVDVNIIFPERVLNDLSTRLMQRYALLPLALKYCFDYCSLFPRDYVIEVPLLLKLWMAQGFAVDEDWGRCYFQYLFNAGFFEPVESDVLETTKCRMDSRTFALSAITSGSRYVLMRSDVKNYIGWPFHVSCDFHLYSERQIQKLIAGFPQLIHSFLLPCQMKSKSDRGMIDAEKIRNIVSPDPDVGWKHEEEIKPESVSDLLISKLEALRALELHDLGIQSLPDYIGGRLKHLRYLDVSRNPDIKLLPNSITKLVNLQALKLSSCFGLEELPKDMKNLINLRHLEIDGCHNLRCMPPELGRLTNLRTLSKYVLNKEVDPQGLEELGKLNNLSGELQIKNLSASFGNACGLARLEDKQHLQSLVLEWSSSSPASDQSEDLKPSSPASDQSEDLKPHMNLKRLTLRGYGGLRLSSWLKSLTSLCILVLDKMVVYMKSLPEGIRSLTSLKNLEIEDCPTLLQRCQKETGADWNKIEHIPNLSGQLSAGKKESLVLEWSSSSPTNDQYQLEDLKPHKNLKRLTLKGYGGFRLSSWLQSFTSLCILVLDNMRNLEYISNEGGGLPMVFPSLRELWLKKLPRLKRWWKDDVELQSLPSFHCLSKLIIQDCPKLVSIPLFPTLEEELMLDTTSLKPFKRTLMTEKTQKSQPPLSKLQNLSFVGIKELNVATAGGIPWETLTSLRVLKLDSLTNLEELPSNLQHLTNLKELHIRRCKVTDLPEWIQDLRSLEKLAIRSCPSMESLPGGIHFLTSLEIEDCPTLLQRCQKETGADRDKIKHIPNLSGQLSAGKKKEQRGED